jgi:hypothetical protein
MRIVLALLLVAPALAFADDTDNTRIDMTALTAAPDACTTLRKDMDEKTACKPIAHAKLAGGATADLYAVAAKDIAWRYAVVVTAGDKVTMSPVIELDVADCGMMKCDLLDGATPKLHAIRDGKEVAVEVTGRFHHENTSPDVPHAKPKTTDRWTTLDAVVCNGKQCFTRHRGMRDHACTGSIANDGAMTTHCDATDYIDEL